MPRAPLPASIVRILDAAKIMGVKAGAASTHQFTGVWPIVVEGRVFARSWTVRRDGWREAFRADPLGELQAGDRVVRVRAVPVRSERLRDAIEAAYAIKYPTAASRKYVRGFRTERRRNTTTEFVRR